MKQRILQFIQYLGISNREFEMKCGMSNGYINSMKGQLGVGKLENLLNAFPQINKVWLMTGEGPMLLTDATGSATDGMGEDGLKERITALERMLDERDARIAELQEGQEESLNL